MDVDQFIDELLRGRKDFSHVDLSYCDFLNHPRLEELNRYFKTEHTRENGGPLILNNANLSYVKMVGIEFGSRVIARHAVCHNIYLERMNLLQSDLYGIEFNGIPPEQSYLMCVRLDLSDLRESNLSYVSGYNIYLVSTDLRGANVEGLRIGKGTLIRTDLRGVKNLKKAKFKDTSCRGVKITREQKGTLLEALGLEGFFDIQD